MSRSAPVRQSKPPFLFRIFLLFFVLFTQDISRAEEDLRIAAAANLRDPLNEIVEVFQKEQPVAVRISYGASGSLFAQLIHGAPFDLFLSAEEAYAKRLVKKGLAKSYFQLGLGRLILWAPHSPILDIENKGMKGLLHPLVRKIAVANPTHAPYGKAAIVALKHFGLYKPVQKKLIFGEDISQAVHFVELGSAEIGIVAYTVVAREKRDYWLIPIEAHLPLKQVGVILERGEQKQTVQNFFQFITTGKGREILHYWLSP